MLSWRDESGGLPTDGNFEIEKFLAAADADGHFIKLPPELAAAAEAELAGRLERRDE